MLWYQSIPLWFQKLFPYLTWQVPNNDKTVYVTFDDGPNPDITPWVLEQLDQHQAKGTFFCVGDNVRKYPETYQQILDKNHRTGNHTMHHLKGWKTDTETYLKDVAECAQIVKSDLFRAPYGRISKAQITAIQKDYHLIMWSLLSCDFEKKLDTRKALEGLQKNTKAGSIIVFHDSIKSEKNLKIMLPLYLQFLNEKGFTCKAL